MTVVPGLAWIVGQVVAGPERGLRGSVTRRDAKQVAHRADAQIIDERIACFGAGLQIVEMVDDAGA